MTGRKRGDAREEAKERRSNARFWYGDGYGPRVAALRINIACRHEYQTPATHAQTLFLPTRCSASVYRARDMQLVRWGILGAWR